MTTSPPNRLLRQARERRGWTQGLVAEQIGASPLSVIRWEAGKTLPTPYYRQKLSQVFSLSLEELGLLPFTRETGDAVADTKQPSASWLVPFLSAPPISSLHFIGRADEIAAVRENLQQARRIALVGIPGIGKTTLAMYVAHLPEISASYPDGILWLGFGPHPQLPTLLGHLALRLGLPTSELSRLTSLPALAQRVQALIGDRRLLVILDDLWQIEDAAYFAITGDHTTVLLTTRFPTVAHAFALEHTVPLSEFDDHQSLQFLAQIAPEVVDHYPERVRELVTAVGGLPLALSLMGAYLQAQHLSGQMRRVQEALTHLHDPDHRLHLTEPLAVMDQHRWPASNAPRSLHAVITLSIGRLNPENQALLRMLALFPPKPNTFSEDAGCAVSGWAPQVYLTALDRLVDAGLITSQAPERYTIHQTIVDVARTDPLPKVPAERLVAYFTQLINQAAEEYTLLDQETTNLDAAWEMAYQLHLTEALVPLTQRLASYLISRGHYGEAQRCLQQCRAGYGEQVNSQESLALTVLLGTTNRYLGHLEEALTLANEGSKFAHANKIPEMEAAALHLGGTLYLRFGQVDDAECAFRAGWHLVQGTPLRHPINQGLDASLLNGLAQCATRRGDYAQAEALAQEGLAVARQAGRPQSESNFLNNLGTYAAIQGCYEQAHDLFLQALEITRQAGYVEVEMLTTSNLALIAAEQGHLESASQWAELAVTLARSVGDQKCLCEALSNKAACMMELQQYPEAEICVREGMELAEQLGDVRCTISVAHTNARLARILKKPEAERLLHEGKSRAQAAQIAYLSVEFDLELGELYLASHQWETALCRFADAQWAAEHAVMRDRSGRALFGKAQALWELGNFEAARQLARQCLGILQQTHSRYVREVEYWLATNTLHNEIPSTYSPSKNETG